MCEALSAVCRIQKEKIIMLILAGCRWLSPVILVTQEAEIRRIAVGSQPLANSS
jgi:hypothetical protein